MTQNNLYLDKEVGDKLNGELLADTLKQYNDFNKMAKRLEVHENNFEHNWNDGPRPNPDINFVHEQKHKKNAETKAHKNKLINEKLNNKHKIEKQNWNF